MWIYAPPSFLACMFFSFILKAFKHKKCLLDDIIVWHILLVLPVGLKKEKQITLYQELENFGF